MHIISASQKSLVAQAANYKSKPNACVQMGTKNFSSMSVATLQQYKLASFDEMIRSIHVWQQSS